MRRKILRRKLCTHAGPNMKYTTQLTNKSTCFLYHGDVEGEIHLSYTQSNNISYTTSCNIRSYDQKRVMDYLKVMIRYIEDLTDVPIESDVVVDLTRVFITMVYGYGASIKGMDKALTRRLRFNGLSDDLLDIANQNYKIVIRKRINGEFNETVHLSSLSYDDAVIEQNRYADSKSNEGYKVVFPKQFNNTMKLFNKDTDDLMYMEILPH